MSSLKLISRLIHGSKPSKFIRYDAFGQNKTELVFSSSNLRLYKCSFSTTPQELSLRPIWTLTKQHKIFAFKKCGIATATCNRHLYGLKVHGSDCYPASKENRILTPSQLDRSFKLGSVCFSDKADKESKEFKENIKTIPNLLTMFRIGCTPILGYMITSHSYQWSLSLLVIAGVTDLLDGYIARTFPSQKTAFGTHLDPLADKLLVFVISLCLAKVSLIPVWLFSIIILRDVLLILAVFYLRYQTIPQPKTFARYWNVNKASFNIEPSTLSKFNTMLQITTISLSLAAPVFDFMQHPALQGLWYLTALTTFITGVQYAKNPWRYVKILNKK